jgi:hypothetical protein
VVDAAGNAYVGGQTDGGSMLITFKYDGATGQPLWTARYSGVSNSHPTTLAIDAAGNAYATSEFRNPDQSSGFAALKYDGATSQQRWVAHYDGPANSTNAPAALALDAAGNAYVTGQTYSTSLYPTKFWA